MILVYAVQIPSSRFYLALPSATKTGQARAMRSSHGNGKLRGAPHGRSQRQAIHGRPAHDHEAWGLRVWGSGFRGAWAQERAAP